MTSPIGIGLRIEQVAPGSALARLGVQRGHVLLAIDGLVSRDMIDVQLELPDAVEVLIGHPDGTRTSLRMQELGADAGDLQFEDPLPGGIRECNNHCEFCFIRGLPKGLRSTLYVFDDDYRYSFLWGNFLTLTNLAESDWQRIGYQRLSPLNVSVHATDPAVRRQLLNNRAAPPILPQLDRLASMGIQVHCQVVLCAGLNDGAVLERTIADLLERHPGVQSLSVVPVGLTRYSRVKNIRRPTPHEARLALERIEAAQAEARARVGSGFVYASDELYLLAGRTELPEAAAYDGFPVLSNGVGMLRSMLDDWCALLRRRRAPPPPPRPVAWLTAPLAAPALERMAQAWETYAGWSPLVRTVSNTLFGEQITVSGLLSGADLIAALRALPPDVDDVVLPRSAFGFDGQATIDGVSAETVGAAHPGRVHLASTPRELLMVLERSRARLKQRLAG